MERENEKIRTKMDKIFIESNRKLKGKVARIYATRDTQRERYLIYNTLEQWCGERTCVCMCVCCGFYIPGNLFFMLFISFEKT